jgi:1L-myo-inositol 1-phosphate cytidylyltransferase
VILAAGAGTRLRGLTRDLPKPLVSVMGKPLIDYTIEAFIQAGFTRLGIVVGHKGHLLQRQLGDGRRRGIRIEYLPNVNYRRGNATSILACQPFVRQEPFVVSVADHMISSVILQHLIESIGRNHILCVDRQTRISPKIRDATKVWVDESGFVERIGKQLTRFNAIDTGVFYFTPSIFKHRSACLDEGICSITNVASHMITSGEPLCACDVSGSFWFDVDTPEDLRNARVALRRREVAAPKERSSSYASSDFGPSKS